MTFYQDKIKKFLTDEGLRHFKCSFHEHCQFGTNIISISWFGHIDEFSITKCTGRFVGSEGYEEPEQLNLEPTEELCRRIWHDKIETPRKMAADEKKAKTIRVRNTEDFLKTI